jgi:hypothetical protein
MRYMMIVKSAEKWGFPPKELMEAIGKLADDEMKSGTMLGSGGLLPSTQGARVRLEKGKVTVIDGPFTEAKEVVGGYAQFEFKTTEEAVESARKFMELHRQYWPGWEGETEVRPMSAANSISESAIGTSSRPRKTSLQERATSSVR